MGYHIRLWLAVDELVQHITELQAQPEVPAEHHAIPRAGVEYPAARDACRPERRGVTYIAEEEEKPAGKYVCSLCGYEYSGNVPFEELPESWVCPVCGAPKSLFKKA